MHGSPRYHVLLTGKPPEVHLWATVRLPFEPKGWLIDLRNDLRLGLAKMQDGSGAQLLRSLYQSNITGRFDLENILLYNVGATSFSHLARRGIVLERRFETPPVCPVTLCGPALHYYCYRLEPTDGQTWTHWSVATVLARWSHIPVPRLASVTKPQVVWVALRSASVECLARAPAPKPRLGLDLALEVPCRSHPNLAAIIKPLLDGVVCALTAQAGPSDGEMLRRLSAATGLSPEILSSMLGDRDKSVLDRVSLVHPFRGGLQWSPDDDLLTAVRVSRSCSAGDGWTMSGQLSLLDDRLLPYTPP